MTDIPDPRSARPPYRPTVEVELTMLTLNSPHNVTASGECARCSHEHAEHAGACRSDVYSGRAWAKCPCDGFADSAA